MTKRSIGQVTVANSKTFDGCFAAVMKYENMSIIFPIILLKYQ